MEAAVGQPVSVAMSREKHLALREAHHLPDVILPTGDQDVFAGVHEDAVQGERRMLWGERTSVFRTLINTMPVVTP